MSSVCLLVCLMVIFFCKQKTAYDVRISDWSSDVCSSDLSSYSSVAAASRPGTRFAGFGYEQRAGTQRRTRLAHQDPQAADHFGRAVQIGRASCRERVCKYV